jgi:aminoglycoside N3'-acetyltransferase
MDYENVAFEDVGNDRCLTLLGDGGQEIGVDFGLVTEFHSAQERFIGGRDGVKWLGKRENEILRSNAVVVEGSELGNGRVKIEIRSKTNVQSKERLAEMVGLMEEVVRDLGKEGRGKRGAED